MKGICSLGLGFDFLRILFVCYQHSRFIPFSESSLALSGKDLSQALASRIDLIENEIRQKEKSHSFSLENIFCNLPPELAKDMIVEDVIPLTAGKKRKLTAGDIIDAKAHIENVFLDWNQQCLHNILLDYYLDDKLCTTLAPVPEGRKLKVRAQLIYIDRKIYKECESIFENTGRKFSGFIYGPLSDISIHLPLKNKISCPVVLNLGREETLCSGILEGRIKNISFPFGEKTLEDMLSERFLFSSGVCKEIFERHITFGAAGTHKEVVIKDGTSYVNVSVGSLNSFIRESVFSVLENMLGQVKNIFGKEAAVSFLGRLSLTKGFFSFLNNRFPDLIVDQTGFKSQCASLLGCAKYGCCRYLETVPLVKKSWFSRAVQMYKEYF